MHMRIRERRGSVKRYRGSAETLRRGRPEKRAGAHPSIALLDYRLEQKNTQTNRQDLVTLCPPMGCGTEKTRASLLIYSRASTRSCGNTTATARARGFEKKKQKLMMRMRDDRYPYSDGRHNFKILPCLDFSKKKTPISCT